MTGVHDWFFYLFSFSIRRRPAGLFSLFTRAPSSGSHLNWYSYEFNFNKTQTQNEIDSMPLSGSLHFDFEFRLCNCVQMYSKQLVSFFCVLPFSPRFSLNIINIDFIVHFHCDFAESPFPRSTSPSLSPVSFYGCRELQTVLRA